MTREEEIYRVTLLGSLINIFLVAAKFVCAIVGRSAAMLADAVHSLSDLITDGIVLLSVKLSSKPKDADHDYGHGKYETLATAIVGLALLIVGVMILYSGVKKIGGAINGAAVAQPGLIALIVGVLSVILKEIAYHYTSAVGRRLRARVVIANAWHQRSDAFSSIGTTLGIAGAIFLGSSWAVLDPLAAAVVSLFVIRTALRLIHQAADELLDSSLSESVEREIRLIAEREYGVTEIHNLCTRRVGNNISIEMHIRMGGDIPLYTAHQRASEIEGLLRKHFGKDTLIVIHVEPIKKNGMYVDPFAATQEQQKDI